MKIPYVTNPVTEEEHGVTVTPSIARAWLALGGKNRNLVKGRVDAYSRDMKAGDWVFQADPVRFSTEGKLLDGRHRLNACIHSNSPFTCTVVTELDPLSQRTMDKGVPRKFSQDLTIKGEKYARDLASAVYWIWKMEEGRWLLRRRAYSPTTPECFEVLDKYPEIREHLAWLKSFGAPGRVVKIYGQMSAIYCLVSKTYPTHAQEFFSQLYSGANCPPGAPALALRHRFGYMRSVRTYTLTDLDRLTLTAYAWKAYMKGRTLKKIQPKKFLLAFIGGPDWDKQDKQLKKEQQANGNY